jgi:type IV pilus assembly protein PilA
MIVVAIIGILAAIAIPKFTNLITKTRVANTVGDLKAFEKAFELYAVQNEEGDNRGYPDDTDLVLPAGVEEYLKSSDFTKTTPLGGRYNWDGPSFYDYAGIAIQNPTAPESVLLQVDQKLDDGDLTAGRFRKTPNGRYTYVLWDK